MASYLKCAFKKTPTDIIGYVAAGGSDWGYVYAAPDGGEPLVYPPPVQGSGGYYIQSNAHNSWFLNMGMPNYAAWKFKGMPVRFGSGNPISQFEYPQMKLCITPNDNNFMRWMDENFYPQFDDVVLVFTWEQK